MPLGCKILLFCFCWTLFVFVAALLFLRVCRFETRKGNPKTRR